MTTASLRFESLPQIAVAEGAVTPSPGAAGGVWAWSTTLAKPVFWTGSAWTAGSSGLSQPQALGLVSARA